MQWAILYHAEGHFEELVELLKHRGYSPEVFCDPHCQELYMPGLQRGSIKCPQKFYVAVPHEERLTAGKIVERWMSEKNLEYVNFKMNTFSKALKALFFTLVILFICCLIYPRFESEFNTSDYVTTFIVAGVLIWIAIFIILILRKPTSPNKQWDFTKPN